MRGLPGAFARVDFDHSLRLHLLFGEERGIVLLELLQRTLLIGFDCVYFGLNQEVVFSELVPYSQQLLLQFVVVAPKESEVRVIVFPQIIELIEELHLVHVSEGFLNIVLIEVLLVEGLVELKGSLPDEGGLMLGFLLLELPIRLLRLTGVQIVIGVFVLLFNPVVVVVFEVVVGVDVLL